LLDFGAGLLIGLSITVALFAAMEESGGRLSHDMLLAALAALVLAIVLKFGARARFHRRAGAPRAGRRQDVGARHAGWTAEGSRGAVTGAHAAGSPGKSTRGSRGGRSTAALREPSAVHREAQESAADGDARRL